MSLFDFLFPSRCLSATLWLMASDYDGAWKDLLHRHLPAVLACYFPEVAAAIDWTHAPEFLDQELRELAIDAGSVDNRVDLLVKVRLRDGHPQRLYLHVEVQSFREEGFAKRAAHSCHRIRAGCGEDVIMIGNRFRPSGALARSLKLEAVISMPGCCQIGL